MIKKKFTNKKGSVLIVSLGVTALLTAFAAGYLGMVTAEARNIEKTHRSNLALHIAESGVEEAIWEIKHNFGSFSGWAGSGSVGDPFEKTGSLGGDLGEYTVKVTDLSGGDFEIEAEGKASFQETFAETRTVKVAVQSGSVTAWQEK